MELEMIPEDVLAEILMRVDIKSLIRLSRVCKKWRALIMETPYFGDKHLTYWGKNQDVAVFLKYPVAQRADKIITYEFKNPPDPEIPPLKLEYLELPLHANNPNMLVRHCNGILCISEGVSPGTIHLCNPTTLEHVLLPPGHFEDGKVYYTENLGFGFDQSYNDYKVIKINRVRVGKSYQPMKRVEVYRLSTNSWSEVSDHNLPLQSRISGPGVFLNGFIHWWDIGDKTPQRMIVRFDLKCESFGELRCPNFAFAKTATLSTLGDCLAVCTMAEDMEFKIWKLTRSGNGNGMWFVLKFRTYAFEPVTYWFHDDSRLVFTFDDYVVVWPIQSGHVIARFYKYDCSFLGGTSSTVFRPSLVSLRNRMISP